MNYNNSFFLFLACLFSFCLCEITEVKKSKLLSDFINYYNFRPNVNHKASDGFLQSISEIDDTTYQIEVSFRAQHNDVSKMMQCQAGIEDLDEKGIAIVNNAIDCMELEQQAAREADASLEAVEVQAERRPVVSENEDEVDPEAQEIQDLAHMGIRHLDIHDPSTKHSLNSVIDVKRQVQVINGIRYIITLSINFNNCTEKINDFCTFTKTCKISILVKPWQTLPSGSKYRAILANNCTEKWQFGDDGEDLSESTDSNSYSKIGDKIGSRKSDTLSQPVKEINKEYALKTESTPQFRDNSILGSQSTKAKTGSLRQDKKKSIDEMLDFLNISGYKPQVHSQTEKSVKRSKRSFDYDLQVLSLTQDYRDLKKSIENAKYVYEMAQVMVDYLNIIDIEVKNRAVKNVIKAEEEEDDDKHFVYIQVQVVIPCDTPNCKSTDTQTKICNGVVDSTNNEKPQVLYSFCYNDNKEMAVLDKFNEVESDDPVLRRLSKEALKKIEFESTDPHAMKIKKIVSAKTRLASSRLTKISMIIEYINCNKSVPLVLRKKCLSLEHLGSRICEVLVHERQWLKEKTITYTCTERPMDFIITKDKQYKNITIDDPIIAEVIQDALQYLEIQSSKKFKQKIIKISNISTQIVAGFLIKIEFIVGYTNCTDTDMKGQLKNCVLLKNERLRRCKAQVWDRSWIVDGRQMEVLCEDDLQVKEILPKTRKKRDVAFVKDEYQETSYKSLLEDSVKKYLWDPSKQIILGGEIEQNSTNPIYLQLAQESLQKYLIETRNLQSYSVVEIEKVTTQVVSGLMTRIYFTAAPNTNYDGVVLECFSKIWENIKKEIDVSCVDVNQRSKRQIVGGEMEQNPNDPVYMQLAQESLQTYLVKTGNRQSYSVGRIKEVTTQVVSGFMTRIYFTAAPNTNYDGVVLECFSKIWEHIKKEIDVSCVDVNQRSKRQIVGGETEQNPNDPMYMQLAQESLKKYLLETGNQQPLLVVRIDKVTTQVISGTMTRISFLAALTTTSNDHVYECFSKIWEQPWLNKTEIDVSCLDTNQRSKRDIIVGGETKQNPNHPLYIHLAKESLQKYLEDTGNPQSYSVGRIHEVTTQVVAGSMTRIHFIAVPNANYDGVVLECFSKIWENIKKEIDVSCVDANQSSKRQMLGAETEQNPNDPVYMQLAQESLQTYLVKTGNRQSYSVGRIKEVTTQVVSGYMTRIYFTAAPNTNYDGVVLECFSKIWEHIKKEIDVSCVDVNQRSKRQIVGGETEQNPNDPVYMQLAQESLKKYLLETGNQQPLLVVRIDKVTTQVISGTMTRISFVAALTTTSNDHVYECFSKIWEQPWLNKTEIDVSCLDTNQRSKRDIIVGGETKQNPNHPLYIHLAKESLQKYLEDTGNPQSYSVGRIHEVTTQVVAGSMTRIHFIAVPNANYDGVVLECFSKIWENIKKEIDVSCVDANQSSKRQMLGAETEQNPNDPVYMQLAQESLQTYLVKTGNRQSYSVGRIKEVTTQVVSGYMTRIYFTAAPNTNYDGVVLECFSKIWEHIKKEIDVSCVDVNQRSKRQIVGGETEQNPNDPMYMQLAQESLKKYLLETGNQQPLLVVRIDKVTTQVISGTMTRISFLAALTTTSNDHVYECFSKIWEQPWLNKTEIDVSCLDTNQRSKRDIIVGGETKQNPNHPLYIHLAKESLQKYLEDTGNPQSYSVGRIHEVTTQVVAGSMTRIHFIAVPNANYDGVVLECFSKIWENIKKEIDVSCVDANQSSKRQMLGAETEQNPNDPVYMQLAQESLQTYLVKTGNRQSYSVGRIKEVTTQVVSGYMTRIYFTAAPNTNYDGVVLECFSKIWEHIKKEIDVSCVDVNQRSKRQIVGGETEQNPNDPVYMQLAQESLKKYLLETGNQQPLLVVRIDKVTTQVISGTMTRISFLAALTTTSNDHVYECFSKIWEQPWLNKTEIDVSCLDTNQRSKRDIIVGGETKQNPNHPLYIHLAKESLQKYLEDTGNPQSYSVGRIHEVTTQVVAGSMTRIHFIAVPNANYDGVVLECFSKIWENIKKEIDVSCVDANQSSKRQMLGAETEQNPNDPVYMQLAQESLQTYLVKTGNRQSYSVGRIKEVTTQVVSGYMTRIYFTAAPNTNYDGVVLECFSKIWEHIKKEIDVSCVDVNQRSKRQIVGGETEQNPNDPVYMQLAQESLKKYLLETGNQQPLLVVRIDKVTTQVISGTMTRISFLAALTTTSNDHVYECFSKIWEQPWLNKTEIDVSCLDTNQRSKRDIIVGGETKQNPNHPLYIHLAKESLQKYLEDTGNPQSYSVGRIHEVTTQIVAGSMTRIHFIAVPNANYDGVVLECFSKIWEHIKKEIDVSCVDANQSSKRQMLGAETEQNPNDPVYMQLAQESLQTYLVKTGNRQSYSVGRIKEVTTQVVSGYMTRIYFTAAPNTNYDGVVLECFSKIWEHIKKEIDVSCVDVNQRSKRQIVGGETEQNPNDPMYMQLAQESLKKYLLETGNQQPLLVVRIDKVTTQVISGTMTRISFLAALTTTSNDHVYECFSKIWEQPWLNKTEIDVSCLDTNQRSKRDIIVGGETKQNPNHPLYIHLAKESLQKYLEDTGNPQSYSVGRIHEVTTQVVAGSMTRIHFIAVPNANYDGVILECFSKIWENIKKEIDVSCVDANQSSKRQMLGAETEQNPNDPVYMQLAQESLQTYLVKTGNRQSYSVGRIKEVTTQVVSGYMTRIYFTAAPNTNYDGVVLECFSKIWEHIKKEIDVSCVDVNQRSKRQIVGGETEQNPNDPVYMQLAQESLKKYLLETGNQQPLLVVRIDKVTTQVISGTMTRISFLAALTTTSNDHVYECFSKIWEQPWLNKTEIDVSCLDTNQRSKRDIIVGGETKQNPNHPLYIHLAKESLQKYLEDTGNPQSYSVGRIHEVTTQVVAGSMTRIHFIAVPNANYDGVVLECFSKIWENIKKEIDVSCVDANQSSKRQMLGAETEQNPNDPVYMQLAQESLQTYLVKTGNRQSYSVGRIKEVTTQVVSGYMTRIYFTAAPNTNYDGVVLECFSKIWEHIKKEIDVSCVDVNQRSKRQIVGGETEQNPNDPMYMQLAQESLKKYLLETGNQQPLLVVRIDKVTTQVISGTMTRISFLAALTTTSNDHVYECFSKIWEQPWLNKTEIDVSCLDTNQRSKRDIIVGGETKQNPNHPLYIHLAKESLQKYLEDTGNPQSYSVGRIHEVTTQIVAGSMTRIHFIAVPNANYDGVVLECFSKIWEHIKKEIDVSCVDANQSSKRQMLGAETEQNPNDPVYMQLAQESLQTYLVKTGNRQSYSVGRIKEVTTQVVSGYMTRIYFTAAPNTNYDGVVLECFSKIWEHIKKEIDVSCVDVNQRSKRQIVGGETEQNPNDPMYMQLAQESLKKYLLETGNQQPLLVVRIDKVTTQVISGTMTRISFLAALTTTSNDHVYECFSKIWEQPWLNKTEIDVSCLDTNQRSKRDIIVGGETKQNPNHPLYIHLAKESLQKYLEDTGNPQSYSVGRIHEVTTQVVAGSMTRIHFIAVPNANYDGVILECFSKIWENIKKEIDVSCVDANQSSKRQMLGAETEQNPNDPVYMQLAQESLQTYLVKTGNRQSYSVGRIKEVTTQVVSGYMTRIYFTAAPNTNYDGVVLECFSKIWEHIKKEIDVSCVDVNQRSKRQIVGGETEQNPNDPVYMQLAQESLKKYLLETGNQQPLLVVRIDKVTTQVISGTMTRISFLAALTTTSNDHVYECFSKIWEQPWLNKTEIDVSCLDTNQRSKRDIIVGGETKQNPNHPLYIHLAKESLQKYLEDTGNPQSYSVGRIHEVTTQVVAGSMTRIHFIAVPNANYDGVVLECFSKIWENIKKEIDVSCVDANQSSKRQMLGAETEQNPNDPVYMQLAQESLQTYLVKTGNRQSYSVGRIKEVTTQVVSGYMTRIYFTAAPNTNYDGVVLECFSKIWEHIKKEIDVSCVDVNQRSKRQIVGGETEQNPNDPVYMQLAQESLKKYLLETGNQQPLLVVRIDKVTTQVISGTMTRISFVAALTTTSNDHVYECFSKIWEQPWLNKTEIDVSCLDTNQRSKRDIIVGGETKQNPNHPLYIHLAKESLQKYLEDTGNPQSYSVGRIHEVTTQVVAGSMTRIHFIAVPNANYDGVVLECFSKIWENIKKEIDVSCVDANQSSKRQMLGAETEQNPNDPVYMQLAQESLQTYLVKTGNRQSYSVGRIKEVTTQVVSGYMTRIYFTAAPNTNYDGVVLECFSKIWEHIKKEIDVSCVDVNQRSKRQIVGGETEQNPNDPVYMQLAQESLKKYLLETGNQQPLLVVRIDKVTTQVISGTTTRISFLAALTTTSNDHVYECFSKIWEQPWLNKTEIDVSCLDTNQRSKRDIIVGGETKQNPNHPLYIHLAKESLQKYLEDTGNPQSYSVGRIHEVTTQIVAGSMTRIHFIAVPNANYDGVVLECFSKIWEHIKKEIDVSCVDANQSSKRQMLGAETEQNPNDPVYMQLAQESLQTYLVKTGNRQSYSVGRIKEVTTQVVSGYMTRIYFTAAPNTNYDGVVLECFSKIWEHIKKEIDVSCVDVNQRSKRQIVGGETEQNPNDPVYMQLAQESLKKYLLETGNQQPLLVVRIDKVTTQVVSGTMTRISFLAALTTNSNDHVYECFSKIWEQPWLNKTEIDVSCLDTNQRSKRDIIVGGETKQNPNHPLYIHLAKESLQKYLEDTGNPQSYSVGRIHEVTTQVVAGSMTRIHFIAVPNANYDGVVLECFSKIWENIKKEIDVSCVDANQSSKRQMLGAETEQNPNDPVYMQLAQESLQTYLVKTGNRQSYSVGRIKEVTTQVVSGYMTRIYFTAAPNTNYDGVVLECFSKIWEHIKKEIDVSCVDVNQRSKRQIVGGETEQNPNDPVYMQLAQESLKKYLLETGNQQPLLVVRIDKVTTQVISGTMTRISFLAALTTTSNDHVYECFSKIWEQLWLNKTEIDVSCLDTNQRSKRDIIVGGETKQNPNHPLYIHLAKESLQKYLEDTGNPQSYSVGRIHEVTTQVVAGSMTRIHFIAVPNANYDGVVLECFSKIWENIKKEIDVSCVDANQSSKRQMLGAETEQNPNDPVYMQLAQESLQTYLVKTGNRQSYSVGRIKEVTTQVVSGYMTRIYFTAAPNTNYDGVVLECFSKIWEHIKKEIDVSCVDVNQRSKRQIVGGETEQNPNDPVYMQLAQESLKKYLLETGNQLPLLVVRIDKVTTQVISGTMTRISFLAALTTTSNDHVYECFSKIWEQPWLNKTEIDVSCLDTNQRSKRDIIVGGETKQNPNHPLYIHLAKESLQKYLEDTGNPQSYSVGRIHEVTTQVVAGSMTRIHFIAVPNANYDGVVLECFSKIWENIKKEIDVSCVDANQSSKRQMLGAETEQNPNDPVYMQLAQESLQTYLVKTGNRQSYSVGRIKEVTTQVVSGYMTRIYFTAAPNTNYDGVVLECFSKIWEHIKKEIDVSCVDVNQRSKRQIVGGETEQNPNDPVYMQLAQESLKKYLLETGNQQPLLVVRVDKVTTQVISGTMTRISFLAALTTNSNDHIYECFSKIWEQPWLSKTEIDVSCLDTKKRSKRDIIAGGETKQNPNDPLYIHLAKESLQKYLANTGNPQSYSVSRIQEVTTQVVAGFMTKIHFTALPNANYDGVVLECLSKIWEFNKKEIDVSCLDANERSKRDIVAGSETEQNPYDPVYLQLAQESLQKYLVETGNQQSYSVARIQKVTVVGSMTRLNFLVAPIDSRGDNTSKCIAEVWTQPLMNKKEIDVFCEIVNINGSGLIEQDPSDTHYLELADKSLQKYLLETDNKEPLKVINVERVTTQFCSGKVIRLNFIVVSMNVSNSVVLKCFSEVQERSLTENINIKVSCHILYKNSEALKNTTYLQWAEESLQKYLSDAQNNQSYQVVQIQEAFSHGFATNIIFVANSTNKDNGSLNCVSFILNNFSEKRITVICETADSETRKKSNPTDDLKYNKYAKYQYNKHNKIEDLTVTKPEFQLLASQSLRQYSKKVGILYKLFSVKMVTKSVTSRVVHTIYFTAFPTDCFSNVSNMRALTCNVIANSTVNCRAKIFGEPNQKSQIQVDCVMPEDYLDLLDTMEENSDKTVFKNKIPRNTQESNAHKFAKEALQEYLSFTDTKYVYRITGLYGFYEHIGDEKIEFSISPTTCLSIKFTGTRSTENCPFKQPRLVYYCHAKRNSRTEGKKKIKVICKQIQTPLKRSKRQINTELIDDTENEVDEDTMYYYAKAAVSKINEKPQNNNMFKLVTIHAVKSTVQMKAAVVKMYLEVAETYCVRFQFGVTIENCEEMEGLNHKLCLARIYPAPGDDLVIRHVNVVCDDDEMSFNVLTGIHVFELLRLSLLELERKPEIHFKLVHQGEPQLIPTLEAKKPLKLNFVIATTNCSKNVDLDKNPYQCYIDTTIPSRSCSSFIWLETATRIIKYINVDCNSEIPRQKRSSSNATSLIPDSAEIKDMVAAALEKLEMASLHRYKQRVLHINSYSSKITTGKVTTIDFDAAYTSCLKYEWVQNITNCDIIDHLPRRHCVAQIWERLWIHNGRHINVTCEDDETPLEAHIEFESAEMAMQLAQEALKHIEAKYPHPQKQKIVRIFSLEKQIVAGIHYKMKVEVGFTRCPALSVQTNCTLDNERHMNRFCRVNVWVRPWTDHPPNFRVSCDFQESSSSDLYHGVQAEYLFYIFVATYNPSYSNDHVEFEHRFEIFRANIKKIHELNVHEKGTATYGVTRFADLTYKEFKARYTGVNTSLRNNSHVSMKEADIPNLNLPANFDWREFDSVSEVKDQGSCGSGWAFSVIGNIEGQWRMQSGELVQLSEQQLLDCDTTDKGCGGGLPEHAYRAVEEMGGLETESNYPYESEGGKCVFNKTMAKVKIQGSVNITSNETAMAQWLVQNGPISVGINAMAMQFYLGGISHPWKSYCNTSSIDHAALIVGFGVKEYPAYHKKIPYWIVKNSWGKSWGEEGYYRVYRGDGTCGIDRMATSAYIPSM